MMLSSLSRFCGCSKVLKWNPLTSALKGVLFSTFSTISTATSTSSTSFIEISKNNVVKERKLGKHDLKEMTGLGSRELRHFFATTRFLPQALIPRNKTIIVCFDIVKAVIFHDHLLVLNDAPFQLRAAIALVQKKIEDCVIESEPFEFAVLEAILSHTVLTYHHEVSSLSAAISVALENFQNTSSSSDIIKTVLPLKHRLDRLRLSIEEARGSLVEVLAHDEDMLEMYLTRASQGIDSRDHQDAEFLLESFENQLQEALNEVVALSRRIDATETSINIFLDNTRNRIMKLNLICSIATLTIGFGALPAAVFGMNLFNSFESHPTAFYWVTGGIVLVPSMAFVYIVRICSKKGLL